MSDYCVTTVWLIVNIFRFSLLISKAVRQTFGSCANRCRCWHIQWHKIEKIGHKFTRKKWVKSEPVSGFSLNLFSEHSLAVCIFWLLNASVVCSHQNDFMALYAHNSECTTYPIHTRLPHAHLINDWVHDDFECAHFVWQTTVLANAAGGQKCEMHNGKFSYSPTFASVPFLWRLHCVRHNSRILHAFECAR